MPVATVNGLDLAYDEHGPADGEPVLLVMGLGAQLVVWSQVFVDHLTAAGYHVVRFDNRDVGESSRFPGPAPTVGQMAASLFAPGLAKPPYRLRDMADDAAGLLAHLGIDRAHVVGASMGGMIAQELAIGHPSRVATLTSIMSNTGSRSAGRMSPKLLPAFLRSRRSPERSVDASLEISRLIAGPHFDEQAARDLYDLSVSREGDAQDAAAGLARQTLAVTSSRDRTCDLRRVTAPTLVVHGLVDPLVRPSGGMATARAIPGARLVMYPDMGHDVPATRVDEITTEIIENCRRAPIPAPERATVDA